MRGRAVRVWPLEEMYVGFVEGCLAAALGLALGVGGLSDILYVSVGGLVVGKYSRLVASRMMRE